MSINNALSESNMGQTESETIQETIIENMNGVIYNLLRQVTELELRLNKVERAYDALGRRLEGSERHPEDEGWFD